MYPDIKTLPAIDKVLSLPEIKKLIQVYGLPLTKFAVQSCVQEYRAQMMAGKQAPTHEDILSGVVGIARKIGRKSLKPVINGTGIILHTNLGRAPFGTELFEEIKERLTGYNNLEFDLETAERGERDVHVSKILKFITGAEDVLIVNNNAAALLLILHVFAKNRECIVSRGELVEIGGSFRVPEIMEASGVILKEAGATNKTKLSDYKNAITANTAALLKVHKSNFVMKGFTHETSIPELVRLGKEHHLLTVYDLGSGLVRKFEHAALKDEPTVKEAIESDIDLVCFSADKMFGSCQAGIIAGKRKYIEALKKHPMMRALRVCKTTIAILEASSLYYLDNNKLFEKNMLFQIIGQKPADIKTKADYISNGLNSKGIANHVISSTGQYGGGAMPDKHLESYSVVLNFHRELTTTDFAKELHLSLLQTDKPLLTNIIKGEIHINMLCIDDSHKETVIEIIANSYEALYHRNGRAH